MKIKEYLEYNQKLFKAQFDLTREQYNNPSNKGNKNEIIIREFLDEVLPYNIKIGHGEIIDSFDKRSLQTDVVVIDRALDHFIKNYDTPNIFIIEAVTFAGEVKAILNQKTLKEAQENCNRFKQLQPKFSNSDTVFNNPSDHSRFYEKRPFFIFAFESELSINNIKAQLKENYSKVAIEHQVDGVFILNKGAIINLGDGKGSVRYRNKKTQQDEKGFTVVCGENQVIEYFITWLLSVMPKITTHSSPIVHYLYKTR